MVTRALASLLFEIAPLDVSTYACAAVVLLAVAAVAAWLPARRAAATDPMQALRM